MKKATFIIIIFTLISKIIGFTRDITLSYVYGANNVSDAYLIAFTIPGVVFAFLGAGIATSYIPIFTEIEKNNTEVEANTFTNNMISFLIVLCTLIIAIGLIFSSPIVRLFAIGFDYKTLGLAVSFTRISMFGIYISVIIHTLASYLNIRNNFHIPALIGIPFNVFIMLSIILSNKVNILFLPIGIIIALLSQLYFILIFVRKEGYKFYFNINLKDYNLRRLIHLSIPVVIGVSVNQINVLVDRTIASTIAVGGITALNYANRLNLFIQSLFVTSIATAMYPMISKLSAENNIRELKKTLSEAISFINLLVLPATIGAMIFAEPVVKLLFGRGAFDSQAIYMTSYALFFYSIGMVGFGLREILSRAFYSLQDTKTPMINAAIAMTMNIILNIILSKYLGIGGLALATSISAIFCTILLFISLRKKIGSFGIKNMIISFIKILCASLVMGLLANASYNALLGSINSNLCLIFSIGIGALSYFIIIYFLKIQEFDIIVSVIKRKLKMSSM